MARPKVILFDAVSLDGRLDGGVANAVDMVLYYGIAAHFHADAMLSGLETILTGFAGQEELPVGSPLSDTKELHPLAMPKLIMADSRARIHLWRLLRALLGGDVIALVSRHTPRACLAELDRAGVEHVVAGKERVDVALAPLPLRLVHLEKIAENVLWLRYKVKRAPLA